MHKSKWLIYIRPLGVWTLLLVYWLGTAFNVRNYYLALVIDQNYDAYLGYLNRALILNPLVRMLGEWGGLPFDFSIDVPTVARQPGISLLVNVSWEIILLDWLAGSFFWLVVLETAAALLYRRLARAPDASRN